MERERTFLVARLPDDLPPPVAILQGYLAVDGEVEVRVRQADDEHVVTIKGGTGRDRTEVETPLAADQFDALWPLAAERCVEKNRHRVPLPHGLTAEVDVFTGRHHGLRLVEVEFADGDDPDAFTPPGWFGSEVTDDRRYANASLAAVDSPPTAGGG